MSNSGSDDEHRVLDFKRRASPSRPAPPIEDLSKYEQGEEADDYRHRMTVNVIAFAFIVALIGAGIWVADTMATIKKNQDCVLSGRRGCTPVNVDSR